MNNSMKKSEFSISSRLAILTLGMLVSVLPVTTLAYQTVTNPVFYSVIDYQGGAWDTVTWYPRESVDLLSGNWRSNLRIGDGQAWIDPAYFPTVSVATTPPPPGSISGGVGGIMSTLVNNAGSPYGLPAGAVTIEMEVFSVPGVIYMGLRDNQYVESEPWLMLQRYTIINTSNATLDNVAFYQYYFPSPYGRYPINSRPSHVDYTEGIGDLTCITLYGEGDPRWAYTALSTDMPPTDHDVGHGGGYPDPPYYWPHGGRPSASSTDVLRQVEGDTMRAWDSYDAPTGSDPSAVAGALKWYIGSLEPGESYSISFQQSVAPHDAPIFIWNQPPDCSDAYADPGCIWPPNHKLVEVDILGVTDPDDDPVTITITGITSDEPTASDEGAGGAKHAPDATGVGEDMAQVRAERSGVGNGRVYEISFVASDGMGGESEGSVTVCVPHDQSGDDCECIDDGQIYDATQIN